MITPPRRFSAAQSRSLSGDGVRQLLASYRGGAADNAAVVPGFTIEPGMIYTQVRAISARINQNYDAWPSGELKKSYKTFLGKPVFVNHANFDPEKARGRVVAARYVEAGDDKYVEVIQEIDAQRFPKLAKEIHEGGLDSVSMGVEAGFTKCSVCDNRATDMTDMCDHVKFHKGEFMRHAKTGEDTMVYENCYKLGFFELSYVFDPADETAVVSRVVVANRRHGEQTSDLDPDAIDPMRGGGFDNGYGDFQPQPLDSGVAGGGMNPARAFMMATEPVSGTLSEGDANTTGSSDPQAFKTLASMGDAWDYIPPPKRKPGKIRKFLKEFADPDALLDELERDKKISEYRNFIKRYPGTVKAARLIVATEIARTDWSDLGRRAYGEGAPAKAAGHPEVAAALKHLDPRSDTARWISSEYQQGYEMAAKTSYRLAAGEDELNRGLITPAPTMGTAPPTKPEENTSTMSELGNIDLKDGDLPYRPTSFPGLTPGAPSGGSSSGGGTSGAGYTSPSGGSADAAGLLDNNRGLHTLLKQNFPDLEIGGYRPPGDGFDEHAKGALDIMTSDADQAAQIRQMGFDNGVPYALWQQQQWNAPWYNGGGVSPMEDRFNPTQNHFDHVHLAPPDMSLMPRSASRRRAWGETEAPEDIDTLREQGEDDGQDDFHRYVESPDELKTPDFDQTQRLDRAQEQQGLDADRRVEDIEEVGGAPTGQQGRGKAMAGRRRRYAEEMAMPPEEAMMAPEAAPPGGGSLSPADELALINQAEQDLEYAEAELTGGQPQGYGQEEEYAGDPGAGMQEAPPEEGGQLPPQFAYRRPVRSTASRRNVRETQKGRPMGINLSERGRVASRGRRLHADESGLTDGGPYGRNDLGESEEVHISDQFGGDGVPSPEAVANPNAGDQISNTENTLVARVQRGTAQLRRDASALAYLRQQKSATRRQAEAECCDDNIIEPTTVNPELSGTDDQTIKGDNFDNIALDNVATQPKDASIHAFAAFDDWLARSTGRTARQHGNANFIRREAARYIRATGLPLNNLFPTLEKVLVEARKAEDITNRKAAMRRVADTKLEVAAPGDRIDVERPVSNVTDAEAQASQYNLSDYGSNAGDNLADPDLSTDSQIWAPGEGSKTSNRMADAVAAVRCAEAYIRAGMAEADDKWKLIARFQTMRHATVVDRTRLLEAKNELDSQRFAAQSRRSAGVSRGATRGIPPGLGSGQRTAQTQRVADNDPRNDALLFFK